MTLTQTPHLGAKGAAAVSGPKLGMRAATGSAISIGYRNEFGAGLSISRRPFWLYRCRDSRPMVAFETVGTAQLWDRWVALLAGLPSLPLSLAAGTNGGWAAGLGVEASADAIELCA